LFGNSEMLEILAIEVRNLGVNAQSSQMLGEKSSFTRARTGSKTVQI
jgi:hypothetical protein